MQNTFLLQVALKIDPCVLTAIISLDGTYLGLMQGLHIHLIFFEALEYFAFPTDDSNVQETREIINESYEVISFT